MTCDHRALGIEPTPDLLFPFVGVAFTLLVSCLIIISSGTSPAIRFDHPPGDAAPPALYIHLSSAGSVHMGGKAVDLASVRTALAGTRFELPRAEVVIVAEEGARAALIFRLVDACARVGAASVRVQMADQSQGRS